MCYVTDVEVVANGVEARKRFVSTSSHKFDKKASVKKRGPAKKDEELEEDDEEEFLPDVGFMRVLKMNEPEWHYMLSELGLELFGFSKKS